MKSDETVDAKDENFDQAGADMVEMGGETTAAATGAAEIGAATDGANGERGARPVGAGTRVRVAGDEDGAQEG